MFDEPDSLVEVTIDGDVAVLALNRASRANAMDASVFVALSEALDQMRDITSIGAIVLCGNGRHFCAGGDLDHPLFHEDDTVVRRNQIAEAYEVTNRLLDHPLPIVSAIQGRCAGAGLALVLGTDIRVAAATAVFSLDFVRLGLVPDMGLCWLLASTVGTGRALDLALSGELIGAEQALAWGLVSRLVEAGDERSTALAIAHQLAVHPPAGMTDIRRLVRAAPFVDRHVAFSDEIETMTRLTATSDARERLQAFRDRGRATTR